MSSGSAWQMAFKQQFLVLYALQTSREYPVTALLKLDTERSEGSTDIVYSHKYYGCQWFRLKDMRSRATSPH